MPDDIDLQTTLGSYFGSDLPMLNVVRVQLGLSWDDVNKVLIPERRIRLVLAHLGV